MGDQRGVARQLGLHGGGLGLGASNSGLGLIGPKDGLVSQADGLIGPKLGGREGRAQRFHVDDFGLGALRHEKSGSQLGAERHGCRSQSCVEMLGSYPARLGRQVCCGFLQSIPSSR